MTRRRAPGVGGARLAPARPSGCPLFGFPPFGLPHRAFPFVGARFVGARHHSPCEPC